MRRLYGKGPLHLTLLVASFAIAAAALIRLLDFGPHPVNLLAWLLGAIVLHDLVLFPLYSLADLISGRALARLDRRLPVPALNHLRVPAALAGLLLLVYFPLILGLGRTTYRAATGREPDGYLARWLAITGALFALSAFAYAFRVRRAAAASRAVRTSARRRSTPRPR